MGPAQSAAEAFGQMSKKRVFVYSTKNMHFSLYIVTVSFPLYICIKITGNYMRI